MFSAALAGGATPFQTPPLLTWFSSFLVRSSANFAKKIQELAEDKAENPRTCRRQSREQIRTNASKKTQISKLCSSKLLSLSQTSLLQKRWAAVLPPGGLQSAAQPGDGVLNGSTRSSCPSKSISLDQVLFLNRCCPNR